MEENDLLCKEMSQEDYIELIENSPELKQKLNEIGVFQSDEGLVSRINYSDLLTEDEKQYLIDNFSALKLKELGVFAKLHSDGIYGCYNNNICDNCFKGLLSFRELKNH